MKAAFSGRVFVYGLFCCLLLGMSGGAALAGILPTDQESGRENSRSDRGFLGLHLGGQANYRRTEVAWHAPALWKNEGLDNRPLAVTIEAALAHWHAVGGRRPVNLWQVSLIPLMQWHFHPDYYLELGIGLTLVSRTRFANKQMATAFQFGDHAGVGLRLGNGNRLGLRLSHFSNASLKTPNPGLNVWQVIYHHRL